MTKKSISTVRAAIGLAFISGSLAAPVSADAAGNPFAINDLGSGYQLASKDAEGKCGEAKCGADTKKDAEGKCGEDKSGETTGKKAEGKCGEGKCGS